MRRLCGKMKSALCTDRECGHGRASRQSVKSFLMRDVVREVARRSSGDLGLGTRRTEYECVRWSQGPRAGLPRGHSRNLAGWQPDAGVTARQPPAKRVPGCRSVGGVRAMRTVDPSMLAFNVLVGPDSGLCRAPSTKQRLECPLSGAVSYYMYQTCVRSQ